MARNLIFISAGVMLFGTLLTIHCMETLVARE